MLIFLKVILIILTILIIFGLISIYELFFCNNIYTVKIQYKDKLYIFVSILILKILRLNFEIINIDNIYYLKFLKFFKIKISKKSKKINKKVYNKTFIEKIKYNIKSKYNIIKNIKYLFVILENFKYLKFFNINVKLNFNTNKIHFYGVLLGILSLIKPIIKDEYKNIYISCNDEPTNINVSFKVMVKFIYILKKLKVYKNRKDI